MTRDEAKLILSVYRADTADAQDPFFADALRLAGEDRELARWFAEEQKRDAILVEKLNQESAVPFGLKTSLLAAHSATPRTETNGLRAFGLVAGTAAIVFLLTWTFLKTGSTKTENALADYRREMVSFVKLTPSLELQTHDAEKIQEWLQNSAKIERVSIPAQTQKIPPIGCRVLNFRGQPVALICFQRRDGQLVHLLVVNRAAFPKNVLLQKTQWAAEGEWMTASWMQGDKLYLLATKGDETKLREFL